MQCSQCGLELGENTACPKCTPAVSVNAGGSNVPPALPGIRKQEKPKRRWLTILITVAICGLLAGGIWFTDRVIIVAKGMNITDQQLSVALRHDDVSVFKAYLAAHPGVEHWQSMENGTTWLHLSVRVGAKNITAFFVDQGANINAMNKNKQTALHIAAGKGYPTITKYLLAHGAKVDARDSFSQTPLILAASGGMDDAVYKVLKKQYPGLQAPQNEHQYVDVVKQLLDHGADVNTENIDKTTPVIQAVTGNRLLITKCLVEHRANVNVKNDGNVSPLFAAKAQRSHALVQYLIAHGAKL